MARHRALTLGREGRPLQARCAAVGRSAVWFHQGWRRYLQAGPEGLCDLTRANHHVAPHRSPARERARRAVRRRLQAHATPATRDRLIGAPALRAELQSRGVRPLPGERTSERVRERNGLTAPRVRLAPLRPRQDYPGPQARASNERHAVARVGPIYLKGSGHRSSLWVGQDAVDGAVGLRRADARTRAAVLGFLGECWKDRGRPEPVPRDHARELSGRPASGVDAAAGGGEHPARPPAAGGKTPAAHRRGLRLQKLPARCVVPTARLPLAAGRVTFLRRVRVAGTVTVLSQTLRVGKRHRGLSLRLVIDTGQGWRTAYLNGRVLKRWPYKRWND